MLLTAGFLFEFSRYIQIISWIILPIVVIIIAITVFLHYRGKKKFKTAGPGKTETTLILSEPGKIGNIYLDHSAVINEYEKELACNYARYSALKQDFASLENKYSVVFQTTPFLLHKNNINMQYSDTPPQFLQSETEDYRSKTNSELNELLQQEELNRTKQLLEKENESLREQLRLLTATDDEKAAIINRWKNEHSALQNKMAEQEYLQKLVDEKKAYIDFLQQQLEQRIRNQHQSEQQAAETRTLFQQMKQSFEDSQTVVQSLNNELIQRQEETEKYKTDVFEKEEQLKEKKHLLVSKLDHIIYLENVLQEIKQQNEILNAGIADEKDLTASLQEKLEDEQSKIKHLEQKLNNNKQMLKRLYKELSTMIDLETDESPVIELKPVYAEDERQWNESLLQ
jgi:chromosome segregation ATPase